MEVPKESVLDSEGRQGLWTAVCRKVEEAVEAVISAAWDREGLERCVSGNLDINPNGNEGERELSLDL
jgi:hypothetical protein